MLGGGQGRGWQRSGRVVALVVDHGDVPKTGVRVQWLLVRSTRIRPLVAGGRLEVVVVNVLIDAWMWATTVWW